jgi:hypothetical protein
MPSIIKLSGTHARYILLCLIFAAFTIVGLQAQITDPSVIVDGIKESTSWTDIIGYEAVIYSFLITVGGYVSAFIPGLRSIDSGTYRVLVWAILVIAGGLVLGFGNVWIGAISYFFSTSLYEVVLKWLKKSPRPAEVNE